MGNIKLNKIKYYLVSCYVTPEELVWWYLLFLLGVIMLFIK